MNHSFQYTRLAKNEAACLLVDSRSGLISLVQDFSPGKFKNNEVARVQGCHATLSSTVFGKRKGQVWNGGLSPVRRWDAWHHHRQRWSCWLSLILAKQKIQGRQQWPACCHSTIW
ncbi:MAG: hypothetical protein ACRER2_18625 [Methylococcales bacterium]